ncbi:MAG TPA: ABC transporter ATP-binding protein [Candidatus Ornithoclostridium faecavium]|nr:ABC transporter ATP-binding protein [Candidatus Ornithoclostridium faecavium]
MNMKTSQLVKRLLKYVKPYRALLFVAVLSSFVSVAASLLTPVLIGDAIDFIIGKDNVDFSMVIKYIGYLGITIACATIFQWLLSWSTNKLSFSTVKDMREDLFDHIDKLPLKYIDSHAHGDLITRMGNDIEQISTGLLQGFSQLLNGVFTILGTLIVMFVVNWLLALVVILITPLSLFVAAFIAKHTHDMFIKQATVQGKLSGFGEEMISNAKVVQAFSYGDDAQKYYEEVNKELYGYGYKAQFYSAMSNPCTRFVNGLVYAAVGITGALLAVSYGTVSAGLLSTFLMYSNQYTKPFNEITGVITELQTAMASARRVFAVLDEPTESDDSALPEIGDCDGTVKLQDVSFGYTEDKILLQHINLAVENGQKIAIVGPTGCGKTTLINLLMRYYDVTDGKIIVSSHAITDVKRDSLRKCFGMVLQETWLTGGTIKENIAYGKRDATDEEIIAAAKAANAHGFITKMSDGYDTVVSEGGDNLSQGQKQLLCIARIMLTHPPMLILDEATSSIDTRTEIKIQKAFGIMMEGRTSFIVAHRLSTIKEADLILVMNDGNIIEQGTHEELLEKKGFYYNLYNSQFAPV